MHAWLGLLKLALANLRVHKLRSGLTILGMAFGTGAVIATLSSSEGAARFIQSELKKLGANTVAIHSAEFGERFDQTDVGLLRKYSPLIDSVGVYREIGNAEARHVSKVSPSFLYGVDSTYLRATKLQLARGRAFDLGDEKSFRHVTVLGAELAAVLFHGDIPIGKQVQLFVEDIPLVFEVIGVLKQRGTGASADLTAFVPYGVSEKIARYGTKAIIASLQDENQSAQAKLEIQAILKARYPSDLQVIDAREAIERNKAVLEKQNLVGLCLALISLLTGGVGIMNIMLLSVTSRRKEIGLRKAVGATDFHILTQFLLEAVAVCLFGGVFGIFCGVWFGQRVATLMGQWEAAVSFTTLVLALGFATLTGILFGIFPAIRASRLDPYEALRT